MNRKELTHLIATRTKLPKSSVDLVLKTAFTEITKILARGEEISLSNFGKFVADFRPSTQKYLFSRSQVVLTRARFVPKFHPFSALNRALNPDFSDF